MNETTARSVLECCNLNPSVTEGLTFSHHASYIYRTAVPLLPRLHFIFIQQIYLIIFLDFLSPSPFIPPQNVVYFLMLPFLVHKIFTFYTNGVLNCKCPTPGQRVKCVAGFCIASVYLTTRQYSVSDILWFSQELDRITLANNLVLVVRLGT